MTATEISVAASHSLRRSFGHAGSQEPHLAAAPCDLKRRSQENRQHRLKVQAAAKQRVVKVARDVVTFAGDVA